MKSDSRVVRRVYDSLAPSYDARWKKYIDATLSLAVDALDLTGQERLLDVACGTAVENCLRKAVSVWRKPPGGGSIGSGG